MYDYLIVGSGLFGSVFANQAKQAGKKCLVIDVREHIGGNCYTEKKEGIDVHLYGPHIFRTSDKNIWKFVNKFTKFNNFVNRPKVNYKGQIFSFPINLMTLHQLWGVKTPEEAMRKLEEVRIPFMNPRNLEEHLLSLVGKQIYETFFEGYTKKQWNRDPKDLPASIVHRIPIRTTFDDNYFYDPMQGIPVQGYTTMFENMLDGIEVKLGVDFFKERNQLESLSKRIVFTGKLDEFFKYSEGQLEYRSLHFEHTIQDGDYQGNAVINYTDASIPFTRITEHKHFTPEKLEKLKKTIYTKEFPQNWDSTKIPYYPINDQKNSEIAKKYKELSLSINNVIFGGRLAEYKYYDMHQVIGSALQKSKKEFSK
jgi:UDP-galactopyranose mutase